MSRQLICALLLVVVGLAACSGGDPAASIEEPPAVDLMGLFGRTTPRVETGLSDPEALRPRDLRAAGLATRAAGEGDDDAEEEGGRLLGLAPASRFRFDAITQMDRTLRLRLRTIGAFRKGGLRLSVAVNGTEIARQALRGRWESIDVVLPAATVRAGLNDLELRYAPLGAGVPMQDATPVADLDVVLLSSIGPQSEVEILTTEPPRLRLPFHVALDVSAAIPVGGVLRVGGLVPWGAATSGTRLAIELSDGLGGAPVRIDLPADGAPVDVPLGFAGLARLTLLARPESAAGNAAGGIDLLAPFALARPATAASPTLPRAQEPANVLIYLVDTLRADHLGVYGYGRDTSPRIDAFARESVVFDDAQAPSSWTKPSVASLFTGRIPQAHGVIQRADRMPPSIPSLPHLLRTAGYETYAVVTNSTVTAGLDHDIGFQHWVQLGEDTSTAQVHATSDVITGYFGEWLSSRSTSRPFFAYLHSTDPHEPYQPLEPYRSRFAPEVPYPDLVKGPAVRRAREADPDLDMDRVRTQVVGLYDAEIAFNDEQFGAVLDLLAAAGVADSTLVILVADHGEEFLDHGNWSHAATLFQEQLHVPLVMRFPDRWQAGVRVPATVGLADVYPTLAAWLSLPLEGAVDGMSLLGAIAEPATEEARASLAHLQVSAELIHESARYGSLKLIRRTVAGVQRGSVLYDLATDPGELDDIAPRRPELVAIFERLLREAALLRVGAGPEQALLDPETIERLRAMGYIQ